MAFKLPETEEGLQMAGCPVDGQLPVGKGKDYKWLVSDDCQLPVGKGKDYKWLDVQLPEGIGRIINFLNIGLTSKISTIVLCPGPVFTKFLFTNLLSQQSTHVQVGGNDQVLQPSQVLTVVLGVLVPVKLID